MNLNRDDYQFLIQPWEYPGANFDMRPDAVTTLEVMGWERVFLLKVREGRVYFRWPGRTKAEWALTVLMPEANKDLIGFWREQVEQGNFGRYTVLTRGYDAFFSREEIQKLYGRQLHRDFDVCPMNVLQRTVVSFIVRADGAVWAREWCGEVWQEFPPKPGIFEDKPDAVWNPANQLRGLRRRSREIGKVLALRVIQPRELASSNRVQWLRCSRAEFLQVLKWWGMALGDVDTGPIQINLTTFLPLTPPSELEQIRRQFRVWSKQRIDYSFRSRFILHCFMPSRVIWYSQGNLRLNYVFELPTSTVTFTPLASYTRDERVEAIQQLRYWIARHLTGEAKIWILDELPPIEKLS